MTELTKNERKKLERQREKRKQLILGVVVALGVVGFLMWEFVLRTYPVTQAWVIVDDGAPLVAYRITVQSDENDDYFKLITKVAETGEEVGETILGDRSDNFRTLGPVFERFMWLREGGELALLDLASHDEVKRTGGLHRSLWQLNVDAQGRAIVNGTRGRVAVDRDGVSTPYSGGALHGRDGDCRAAAKAVKASLNNSDARGCWEQRAFVQHSAGTQKGNWQLSLVEPDGTATWTVEAAKLTGSKGWFGHAVVHEKACWVAVVEGGDVRFVELEPTTGAVKVNREL